MKNKKIKIGQCHLCGKTTELTREHVPPKSALNNNKVMGIDGENILNAIQNRKFKTSLSQNGAYTYSLCRKCNNNTGSWYADYYVQFCRSIAFFLQDTPNDAQGITISNLKGVNFGYIIKQILCMFVSYLKYDDIKYLGLEKYLLKKDNFDIDTSKFKLYCYVNSKHHMFEGIGKLSAFTTDGKIHTFSSIKTYPLGFILSFTPNIPMKQWEDMLDMEPLIKSGGQTVMVELGLPILSDYEPFVNVDEILKKAKCK